jgi:hypothetical protein
MLHKQAIDFSTFLKQGGVHQIVGYDRFWTAQPRTLHQRYDDLMTNPEEGVRQIAEHLEISVSPNEVEELVERFSLESTRERTRTMTSQLQASGVDLNARENALVFDPTTLLHWNHVRTGRGGGWRERIGPRDLAILGRLVSRWLVLRGYEPDDTWAASAGAREPGGSLKILQGNLAYQLRRASLAYPQASRLAKRVLRLPERNQAREIKAVTAQSA